MLSAGWNISNSTAIGFSAVILSAGLTSIVLAGNFAAGDVAADRPAAPPPIAPVDAPDVPGGYASTHIVIQVQPGTAPRLHEDLRWTVEPVEPAAVTPERVLESFALAAALDDWFVEDIRRSFEPKNEELAAEIGLDRFYHVQVPRGTDTPEMADAIREFEALIVTAEVDPIEQVTGPVFPNDELFDDQWALHNTGQTGGTAGADISAPGAWAIHNDADDDSVILAVLDTGVHEHADLEGRLVPGWNIVDDNDDTNDVNGHGTHVAGSAAANANNGLGIAGVSWGARIMPVKVFDDGGSGLVSWNAQGIVWATDNGADVINYSGGGNSTTSERDAAVEYAHEEGVVHVTSAGNQGDSGITYPALYPETIAVGATNHNDVLASFSSTGPELSVVAPGVSILSLDVPEGYRLMSGTSMAAPHVAGLACLLLSYDPDLTEPEIRQILEVSSDDLGEPGFNPEYGWGRINAEAALMAVEAVYVPEDFQTIQEAVDNVNDGELILVSPGTYDEALDFGAKNIEVRSTHGAEMTTLDAAGSGGSAVTIAGGQDANTVLEGFTITGGTGTFIDGETFGGGLYIAGSSPRVTGNIIMHNEADHGGGIFADEFSSPAIGGTFFCQNDSDHILGPFENLGGIEFCTSVPVPADLVGLSVEQGSLLSGGLEELGESNDQYVEIFSAHSQGRQRTTTVIDAQTDAQEIEQLDLTIETGVEDANATVTTHVELWNFNSASWDEIDSFAHPGPDTVSAYEDLDVAAYISSSGSMSVRLRTVANLNPNNPYLFLIDHVEFLVHEPIEIEPGEIQQMIDEAQDGDVITLEPGVYNEVIDFQGKAITLRSTDPDDPDVVAATVIDGTGFNSSVVTATSGEGPDTVIEGLTITGGTGTIDGDRIRGGGMFIEDSSPTIANCVFTNNLVVGDGVVAEGGAMYVSNGNPTITNTDFIDNAATSTDFAGAWAGALSVRNNGNPTVTDCDFIDNTANIAGATMVVNAKGAFTGCEFRNNFSQNAQAGAMYLQSADSALENCHFENNVSASSGGAISMASSEPQIDGSTFINNSAIGGSAISLWVLSDGPPSTADLNNCVVKNNFNSASEIGAIHTEDEEGSVTQIANSFVCNNDPIDITGPFEDLGGNEICETDEPVEPETIEVPEDAETITEAIGMAEDGDIILVAEGTYNEAIDFAGLNIHIQSTDGPEVTVIDASGLGTSAVTFNSGESADAILEGFTVTGGEGTLLDDNTVGGGVFINASSPTITDIIIEGNTADYGAGIFTMNEASPTVSECLFVSNIAIVAGGGMYNEASDPLIEFCDFEANSADYGGGMFNHASDPEIVASVFFANTAIDGGAMYNEASDPLIESCDIVENVAEEFGGGIFSDENSLPALADSFVCDNEPDQIDGPWDNLGGNTICPDDPGEPFTVPLLAYEVEIGVQVGSFDLIWFTEVNQQYLFIESRRTQGRHRTNTIVDVDAGTDPIVQLDVHTVSGLETAPPSTVTTFIELWNFDTGEWVAIDSFDQSSTGDQSSSTINVANPDAYVAGNGTLHVRVRSEAPGNPHQSPYVYRIDLVEVVVTPAAE